MDELLIPLLSASAVTTAIAATRTVIEAIRKRRAAGKRKSPSIELSITDPEGRNVTIEVPTDDEVALESALLDAIGRTAHSGSASRAHPTTSI